MIFCVCVPAWVEAHFIITGHWKMLLKPPLTFNNIITVKNLKSKILDIYLLENLHTLCVYVFGVCIHKITFINCMHKMRYIIMESWQYIVPSINFILNYSPSLNCKNFKWSFPFNIETSLFNELIFVTHKITNKQVKLHIKYSLPPNKKSLGDVTNASSQKKNSWIYFKQ